MIQYLSQSTSQSKYQSFFRTLQKNSPTLKYQENIKTFNCHDGQRKLLYSEIEFYTLLSQKYPLHDILVVYAGSGEGLHMSIIFDLFPELDFILIDPNRSLCDHPTMKNKEKVKMLIEYYTDSSYLKIGELNTKHKKIVFMSDIREDTDEMEIWKNMIQQQLWCIQLNSIAYLLKFRLPYLFENFDISAFRYTLPLQESNLILNNKEVSYLKGDIYLQIYPPLKSTETRLIYIRNENEPFSFQAYNIETYEEQCFYFNQISRKQLFSFEDSKELKYNILGYDDSYESVCEYYLMYQYIHSYSNKILLQNKNPFTDILSSSKNIHEKVISMIYYINHEMIYILNKDIITCKLRTMYKTMNWNKITKNEKMEKYIAEYVIFSYLQTIQSLKLQITHFSTQSILEKKDYENQINLLYDILYNVNEYTKNILQTKIKKYKSSLQNFFIQHILHSIDSIYFYITQSTPIIPISFDQSIFLIKNKDMELQPMKGIDSYEHILETQLNNFFTELKKKVELKKNRDFMKSMVSQKDYYDM